MTGLLVAGGELQRATCIFCISRVRSTPGCAIDAEEPRSSGLAAARRLAMAICRSAALPAAASPVSLRRIVWFPVPVQAGCGRSPAGGRGWRPRRGARAAAPAAPGGPGPCPGCSSRRGSGRRPGGRIAAGPCPPGRAERSAARPAGSGRGGEYRGAPSPSSANRARTRSPSRGTGSAAPAAARRRPRQPRPGLRCCPDLRARPQRRRQHRPGQRRRRRRRAAARPVRRRRPQRPGVRCCRLACGILAGLACFAGRGGGAGAAGTRPGRCGPRRSRQRLDGDRLQARPCA